MREATSKKESDTVNMKDNWNAMAEAYENFTNRADSYSMAIEKPAILSLLPDLGGKTVLDLGCGTGRYGFILEELGARRVIGIDQSDTMLQLADKQKSKRQSSVDFILGDAQNLEGLASGSIDLVFSSTLLHFIEDLTLVMEEVHRVLKPGGQVVLSLIHPVYSAQYPVKRDHGQFPEDDQWTVRYLDKGKRAYVQPWIEYNDALEDFLTESYHHTFSDYCSAFIASRFTISSVLEPQGDPDWCSKFPRAAEAFKNIPTYCVFRLEKK